MARKQPQFVDPRMHAPRESFSPQRPSAAFDPFVRAVLRQIGESLDLSYEELIKDFASLGSAEATWRG